MLHYCYYCEAYVTSFGHRSRCCQCQSYVTPVIKGEAYAPIDEALQILAQHRKIQERKSHGQNRTHTI